MNGQPPVRSMNYQYDNRYENENNYPDNPRNNGAGFDMPLQNGFYNNQRVQQHHEPTQNGVASGVIIAGRVIGTVKWYNFKNGFGFVTRNDNNQDIFVHRSGIQHLNSNSQPGLDDGEPVEFDIVQEGNRLIAINVTGPSGNTLRGSKYASAPVNPLNNPSVPTKVFHRRKVANN